MYLLYIVFFYLLLRYNIDDGFFFNNFKSESFHFVVTIIWVFKTFFVKRFSFQNWIFQINIYNFAQKKKVSFCIISSRFYHFFTIIGSSHTFLYAKHPIKIIGNEVEIIIAYMKIKNKHVATYTRSLVFVARE